MQSRSAMLVLMGVSMMVPARAGAFEMIEFYLSPSVGYAWYDFKSMEIEKSFISPSGEEPEGGTPSDVLRSVGSKSVYDGSGVSLGSALGVNILALSLGVHYEWIAVEAEGYAKHFHYYPEEQSAAGRKVADARTIDVHRVLFELCYNLPVSRLTVVLKTRVGSIFLDDNGLIIGRAVDAGKGFTADLGMRVDVAVLRWLKIGLQGYFGFFSFTGTYEGTMGIAGGLNTVITFEL